jgi:solute carrier family 25 S-adenosylmethionine transporter 26
MGNSSVRKQPSYSSSLAAGALSGLSVDLLFYPIDTLKTRLQSSQGFLQAGGFSGIYRGIGSVAVGSAPGAACFFVAYESLKPFLMHQLNAGHTSSTASSSANAVVHMSAASIAEVAACLIRVPTEVVKSRQQTSTYGQKVSSLRAFQAVVKEQGIRGLYAGFAGTVGREVGILI